MALCGLAQRATPECADWSEVSRHRPQISASFSLLLPNPAGRPDPLRARTKHLTPTLQTQVVSLCVKPLVRHVDALSLRLSAADYSPGCFLRHFFLMTFSSCQAAAAGRAEV